MNYKIELCTNIHGHHVCKASWKPEIGERVICYKTDHSEALEYDMHAITVYKKNEELDEKLVGHPHRMSFHESSIAVRNNFLKLTSYIVR